MTQSGVEQKTLHQAILAAYDHTGGADKRRQAEEYCVGIANHDEKWKLAIEVFRVATREEVKFWCLQSIELQVKSRWEKLSNDDKTLLRSTIMDFYSNVACTINQTLPVRNKLAVILVHFIRHEYPNPWQSFFSDLAQTLQKGPPAVDLFFRVLITVDEDIIEFARSSINSLDHQAATRVKDSMRLNDLSNLAKIWYEVLAQTYEKQPKFAKQCLKLVDLYINWMPLNLVVNDTFLPLCFQFLEVAPLQKETCDCFYEILKKRMPVDEKLELIEKLQIIQVLRKTEAYKKSHEFALGVSEILTRLMEELRIAAATESKDVSNYLSEIMDLCFIYLGHSEADVVTEILECLSIFWRWHTNSQKSTPMSSLQLQWLRKTYEGVTSHFPFPEDYNPIDSEDPDEEIFEFRKQLDKMFKLCVRVNPEKVLNFSFELFMELINNFENLTWSQVEGCWHILFILGENVNRIDGYLEATQFTQMLQALLQLKDTQSLHHPAVCLEYFNIITRYFAFFEQYTSFLPGVLKSFADEHGMRHSSATVRAQAAYRLKRWLASLTPETKTALRPYVKDFMQILSQAVRIYAECSEPENRAEHGSLERKDMNFLCDSIAQLCQVKIVGGEQESLLFFQNTILPLIQSIELMLNNQEQWISEQGARHTCTVCLSDLLSSIASATKSFNNSMLNFKPWLKNLVNLTMRVYSLLPQDTDLRDQFVFLLHQQIRCLSNELIPFIPSIWQLLLASLNSDNVIRTFQLINSMLSKLSSKQMKSVVDENFFLILQAFDLILKQFNDIDTSTGAAVSHRIVQRRDIIKHYYLLLSAIVKNSELSLCLVSERNMRFFQGILDNLLEGCQISDLNDYHIIRSCFTVFRQLIRTWGTNVSNVHYLKSVLENELTLKTFTVPLNPRYNFEDAGANECLKQICCLQCGIFKALGQSDEYLTNVGTFLVTRLQTSTEQARQYCETLQRGKHVTLINMLRLICLNVRENPGIRI